MLDLLLAAQLGSGEVVAGPSFDDHVALIHEREQLVERMEDLQAEVQVLESLGTWYSIHLQDAECAFGSPVSGAGEKEERE